MPGTKRRKLGAHALHKLTIRQAVWLETGGDLLPCPGEAGIADDAHARQLWLRYRDDLLEDRRLNCNHPGRRPWGFWAFDVGLEQMSGREFRWPRGCSSESETIRKYYARPGERELIEADWRRCCRIAISSSYGAPRPDPAAAATYYGVPRAFFRQHAPQIEAELAAERRAWQAKLDPPLRNGEAA